MQKFIRISRVARATKSDKTKRTIFLRIFPSWENEKDITFSTKITVSENRWNNITKSISGPGIESNRYNTQINQLEAETQNIFQQYINGVEHPKRKEFKAELEFKLFNKGLGKTKDFLFRIYLIDTLNYTEVTWVQSELKDTSLFKGK